MIMIKESGKEYGLPFFIFIHFVDSNLTCLENHMQKGYLLFLQEMDYNKANATND
jgi:hypothetical protein